LLKVELIYNHHHSYTIITYTDITVNFSLWNIDGIIIISFVLWVVLVMKFFN